MSQKERDLEPDYDPSDYEEIDPGSTLAKFLTHKKPASGPSAGAMRAARSIHAALGAPFGVPDSRVRDLASLIDRESGLGEAMEALRFVAGLIPTARGHFPKSIRNSDTFRLENACATIGKALARLEGREVEG